MKQIASPGVAMDIQSGKIETVEAKSLLSSKKTTSFVQTAVSPAGVGRHEGHAKQVVEHEYQQHNPKKDFQDVVALIKNTQSVAQKFLTCMARNKSTSMLEKAAVRTDPFAWFTTSPFNWLSKSPLASEKSSELQKKQESNVTKNEEKADKEEGAPEF